MKLDKNEELKSCPNEKLKPRKWLHYRCHRKIHNLQRRGRNVFDLWIRHRLAGVGRHHKRRQLDDELIATAQMLDCERHGYLCS